MVRRLRPDVRSRCYAAMSRRASPKSKGEVAATLLALAGLKRLGLEAAATAVLDVREFVPAPGQGAIAITMRGGDDAMRDFLAPVLDAATGVALAMERAFLRVLDGSCKTPIGAFARVDAGTVAFRAIVLKPDGSRFFETEASGPLAEAATLGETAGQELVAQIPADFFGP